MTQRRPGQSRTPQERPAQSRVSQVQPSQNGSYRNSTSSGQVTRVRPDQDNMTQSRVIRVRPDQDSTNERRQTQAQSSQNVQSQNRGSSGKTAGNSSYKSRSYDDDSYEGRAAQNRPSQVRATAEREAARQQLKEQKRKQVVRNRICVALVIVAVIMVAVVVIVLLNKNKNNNPGVSPDSETSTTASVSGADVTAPVITGPETIEVSLKETVSYKSYIKDYISDDVDSVDDLTIEVDSSQVNMEKEGKYPITFTVTDKAGNSATHECTVVVGPWKGTDPVPEEKIYELADKVLDEIIEDGMTDLEKIFAIFFYVRETFTYRPDQEYLEYKQEAYKMMTTLSDNCYANDCVTKLLLERIGIESQIVTGHLGYIDEPHYWVLATLDKGENWYYIDPAWWTWQYDEYPLCMLTEDSAMAISDRHGGIFIYDRTAYPTASDIPLYDPEELGFTSKY